MVLEVSGWSMCCVTSRFFCVTAREQEMKKVNPRNKPASFADIERAKKKSTAQALVTCEAIFLTVLLDKFGMEDQLTEVWKAVNKLSSEISEGRVSLNDLINVLEDEYGVEITKDL